MFSHFTLDTHFTILFKFIKVHSITGVILTCVAFALLGILYEGIRCLRMNLAQKVSRNVSSNSCLSKMHAIQTLLHLFEISLGYALMLVVMTYNGWLFIANVIGLTIGLQLCVLYSKSHHMKPSTYQLKAQPSHSLNYHNDGATVRLAGEEVKDDRRTGSQQQTIKSVSHHSAGDEEIVETTHTSLYTMDPDTDSAVSTEDMQSAADENLFITDMRKEITRFTSPDALTTEKIEAVNHIGYIAYIAGEATTELQKSLLPELSSLVTDECCTNLVKTRVLITLSLMAYSSQSIQNLLCADQELLETLFRTISDTEEKYLCQLACNLLLNIVIGNMPTMKKIRDMPEIEKSLIDAAGMNADWMPWHENLADILLKFLGFRSLA